MKLFSYYYMFHNPLPQALTLSFNFKYLSQAIFSLEFYANKPCEAYLFYAESQTELGHFSTVPIFNMFNCLSKQKNKRKTKKRKVGKELFYIWTQFQTWRIQTNSQGDFFPKIFGLFWQDWLAFDFWLQHCKGFLTLNYIIDAIKIGKEARSSSR